MPRLRSCEVKNKDNEAQLAGALHDYLERSKYVRFEVGLRSRDSSSPATSLPTNSLMPIEKLEGNSSATLSNRSTN